MTTTPMRLPGAGLHEPIDMASATWSPAIDWFVGAVLLVAGVTTGAVLGAPVLAVLFGILCGYAWFAFRALRMRSGVEMFATQAAGGSCTVRVVDRGRTGLVPLWSMRPTMLAVGDGVVRLGDDAWPASLVLIEKSPNLLLGRGIGLSTPSGRRFVTFVPGIDPALYWSALVDQPAVEPLRDLLAINAASSGSGFVATPVPGGYAPVQPPSAPSPVQVLDPAPVADPGAEPRHGAAAPGWYGDPAGSGRLRWWDGTRWTEQLH